MFWKNQKLTKDILNLMPNFNLVFSTDGEQKDLILINKLFF